MTLVNYLAYGLVLAIPIVMIILGKLINSYTLGFIFGYLSYLVLGMYFVSTGAVSGWIIGTIYIFIGIVISIGIMRSFSSG